MLQPIYPLPLLLFLRQIFLDQKIILLPSEPLLLQLMIYKQIHLLRNMYAVDGLGFGSIYQMRTYKQSISTTAGRSNSVITTAGRFTSNPAAYVSLPLICDLYIISAKYPQGKNDENEFKL
jgi:hypothetical protein